jgi:hypothetical protein
MARAGVKWDNWFTCQEQIGSLFEESFRGAVFSFQEHVGSLSQDRLEGAK